jgi:glycosyltransferase involved in cell wall biosynthesis
MAEIVVVSVSLIEPVGGHGGMNYYDMSLAKGLSGQGVDVAWYTCDKTTEESCDNIQVVKCFRGVYGDDGKLLRFIRFIKALLFSLNDSRKKGCKIVHYHFFGLGSLEFVMCLLAKVFRRNVCVTVHDVESFSSAQHSIVATAICRMTDKFIVHNECSRDALSAALPNLTRSQRPAIIHHGNYCEYVKRVERDAARKRIGLNAEDLVILFFGQIKEVKGLDILLQAMPRVIAEHPKAKLVIAGKVWKDDFKRYQALINELGIASSVEAHIRYIPDQEVDDYYSSANVVALPYRKIYQSGVLLMAMSYGLPVVASDLDGMTEVISDGVDGYLFEEGNADSLASKLSIALQGNGCTELMGKNALNLMNSQYSWSNAAVKTKVVYEELV